MTESIWLWVGFNVFVLAMLALDLGVFHRKAHIVSLKESFIWTGIWVALALVFNAGIWHYAGSTKALEFSGFFASTTRCSAVILSDDLYIGARSKS